MSKIKAIKFEIMPQYFSHPHGGNTAGLRVEVHLFGKPKLTYEQTMPEDDFQSLFDVLMETAKREIKKHFEQPDKGD